MFFIVFLKSIKLILLTKLFIWNQNIENSKIWHIYEYNSQYFLIKKQLNMKKLKKIYWVNMFNDMENQNKLTCI